MKSLLILVFLYMFSMSVKSDINTNYAEVNDTLDELGIELSEFTTLWPFYCNPEWSKKVSEEKIRTVAFIRNNIRNNFFASSKNGADITLSQGTKCKALLDYYLNGENSESISSFIVKDKLLINKYGFSAIDLFQFPENFQGNLTTTNPAPGHSKLILDLINRFKKNDVFDISDKSNGKYHIKPSNKFIQAHKKIKSAHDE